MFESKYSKLLTILLIVGIVIIIGVLVFVGISTMKSNSINKDAEEGVEQFQNKVSGEINNEEENVQNQTQENVQNVTQQNTILTNEIAPIVGVENIIVDNNNLSNDNNNSSNDNKNTYKGFTMVGTIEIPSINLKYPVLEDASKSAMEVAVGIYDGPGLNKVGNTTIAGHNYRNGTFFSNNKKLENNDKIYITDISGQKITYIIYKIYTTSPEDSEYLGRNTNGKRELSLTTCTDDSQSRLIIWAKEQ